MKFSRWEHWSELSFPAPGDLPDPGIEHISPESPVLAGRLFTTAPPGQVIEYPEGSCLSSAQSLSHVRLFATPWTATGQASLSITNSRSLLKLVSIELVTPSNHPILCRPLLLPPSIFPTIRVFSSESVLCIRWQKYWSFSFSISPSSEYSGLISFRMDWMDLLVSVVGIISSRISAAPVLPNKP